MRVLFILLALSTLALAQQGDKLIPYVAAQRNSALDAIAQCSLQTKELQDRIVELEKQLEKGKP